MHTSCSHKNRNLAEVLATENDNEGSHMREMVMEYRNQDGKQETRVWYFFSGRHQKPENEIAEGNKGILFNMKSRDDYVRLGISNRMHGVGQAATVMRTHIEDKSME